ncbi:putative conserved hypothetical protein [Colletotrichum sublineola]|uniref:Rhodopsin domain-containing protein n=1 Tax=Colletotrichum sublineola TaxID=1173701 RepID=A0A066WSZ4_COLSU|nr:putative conserved hypothetical protein [Colletotrichum sublineola]
MTELNHTPESAPPPSGHLVKAHYYVGGLGLCLSILFVILRLSHRHSSRRLGWDDGKWHGDRRQDGVTWLTPGQSFCFFPWYVRSLAYRGMTDGEPPGFLGRHADPDDIRSLVRDHVLPSGRHTARSMLHLQQVAMAAITVAITAGLFIARPGTSSVGAIASFLAAASSHIVTDIVLVVLTILRVSRVQLPLKKKLFATGIFSLGLITAGISTAHLILLTQLLGSSDLTWDAAPASIISLFEVNLYAIFACTPEVRNVFRDIKSQWTVPADPSHVEDRPAIPSEALLPFGGFDLGQAESCNASTDGTGSSCTGSIRELP